LVHISELSNRFIKEPSEAVKTGQIVKVKVLSVDTKAKRIALSIKQLTTPTPRTGAKPEKPSARPESPAAKPQKATPKPQPTLDEKLSFLSTKWKVR
jgi:uncharacterized protein